MVKRLFSYLTLLAALVLGLPPGSISAQPVEYGAEIMVSGAASDSLPFWMTANQFGRVDPRSTNARLSFMLRKPLRSTQAIDYGLGAELFGRASAQSSLHVHQLYGTLKTGPLRLQAGWRPHTTGLIDSTLSMGSTMWSRNAPPMPKLSVAVPEYVTVPGTRGFLAVRGYMAHGWFGPGRYVDRPYLHEKYAYVRIRFPRLPIQGHAGLHHNVVWAGTHPTQGDLPDGFRNLLRVALGQGAPEGSNTAIGEQTNVFGNSVAAYDFGVTFTTNDIRGQASRQVYAEDTPGLALRNVWDGLWSFSIHRMENGHPIDALLYEHFRMTRQGARSDLNEPRGTNNAYNHSIYRSGWTYRGRTIGTPLLTAGRSVPGIVNNIVVAHHLGLAGTIRPRLRYQALVTYSRNYGASRVCPSVDCATRVPNRTARRDRYTLQFAAAGARTGWPDGLSARLGVAADLGAFTSERFGLSVGLRWQGLVRP